MNACGPITETSNEDTQYLQVVQHLFIYLFIYLYMALPVAVTKK
jgi:hypothetical protein